MTKNAGRDEATLMAGSAAQIHNYFLRISEMQRELHESIHYVNASARSGETAEAYYRGKLAALENHVDLLGASILRLQADMDRLLKLSMADAC